MLLLLYSLKQIIHKSCVVYDYKNICSYNNYMYNNGPSIILIVVK